MPTKHRFDALFWVNVTFKVFLLRSIFAQKNISYLMYGYHELFAPLLCYSILCVEKF